MPDVSPNPQSRPPPKTVVGAKSVDLVLLTYTDDNGNQFTQPALVGDKHVHLIDGRLFGVSRTQTPQGQASTWLRDALFAKLGRKVLP